VTDELLFSVVGSTAQLAEEISLGDAGLRERDDLQEWVIAHPQMLGPGVMIVTFEFDRWWSASGSAPADRLDVLGLDSDGFLVVAELKRDRAPDTVEMQAIKYAAMASRFTLETLSAQHARFLTLRGQHTDADEAQALLLAHAPDLSAETLRRPRIVLLARDFLPVVTASVVWLTEMGLDITLQRFQAYRSTVTEQDGTTHSQVLINVGRLYPVRDVEDFTVSPERAVAREVAEKKRQGQEVSAVRRLVEAGTIEDGTEFTFSLENPDRGRLTPEQREAVRRWLDEQPDRWKATWQNNPTTPLVWGGDGGEHSPSGLVKAIAAAATGLSKGFHGTQWWRDTDGSTLVELAGEFSGAKTEAYREFWTRFFEEVRIQRPNWSKATTPPATNWFQMPSPYKGAFYLVSFAAGGRLRSELYIDTGDAATSLALFNRLRGHATDVEAAYGGQLSWEELSGKRACRISDYRADADVLRSSEHDAYIEWLIDANTRLRTALDKVIPPS
jgi:hypothetical protein